MKHIRKAKQKSNINSTSGITIISLTITIVVLIIISLITVNLTLGEGGIFNHANRAKTDYEIEAYIKEIEIARVEVGQKNLGIVTIDNLIRRIEEKNIISGGTITKIDEETAKAITKEGYEIIITAEDTLYDVSGKIMIGTPTWNKSTHKASVTISKGVGVDASLQIQYQVVTDLSNITESGWITGTSISNLNHNDYVCARLWDGTKEETQTHIQVKDNIAPTVTVNITRISGNSITVSVNATDDQYGMETNPTYTFYIKKTNELNSAYVQKQSNTNSTCTFTGLAPNTSYTIKVTTQDKAGNTGTGTKEESTRDQITVAKGNLTISDPEWNATTHKASVTITKASGVDESLQIQYQVVTSLSNITEEGWITGTSVGNLNHNDYVCARFWNGSYGGEYTSIQVKDNIEPTVTVRIPDAATNGLPADVSVVDNEYGMPDNPVYTFYIKKTSEPDTAYVQQQSGTTTYCSFRGLTQNTSYTVKVTTTDKAGNIGIGYAERPTYTVATASGNLTISAPTWNATTHKASVTITKGNGVSGLQEQYQVVTSLSNITEEGWITGTSVGNLNHNDYVCARLWDGTNGGEYTSIQVKDGIKPTVTADITETSTKSITVSASAVDNQYGMPTNPTYTFYIKKASEADSAYVQKQSDTNTCTFTGLTQNTNYTIKVTTKDKAGNTGTGTKAGSTEIQLVTEITLNKAQTTIEKTKTETLIATIKPSDANDKTVTWTSSNTKVATVNNGVVTAIARGTATITVKAMDGSDKSASCVVTVPTALDDLKPGDYISYNTGTYGVKTFRVLYDAKSPYGIQIISDKTLENIQLGDGTWSKGRTDYNAAVTKLNEAAMKYCNKTYATDARCVGSNPSKGKKNEQPTTTFKIPSSYTIPSELGGSRDTKCYNVSDSYNTFHEIDQNAMKAATSQGGNLLNNGQLYWFASRKIISSSSYTDFYVLRVNASGNVYEGHSLCFVTANGSVGGDYKKCGLRPCILLKNTLKVTGGNGSSTSPYTLGV